MRTDTDLDHWRLLFAAKKTEIEFILATANSPQSNPLLLHPLANMESLSTIERDFPNFHEHLQRYLTCEQCLPQDFIVKNLEVLFSFNYDSVQVLMFVLSILLFIFDKHFISTSAST